MSDFLHKDMEGKMSNHSGIETWGKNRRELRGKRSKAELISEIGTKFNRKVVDLHGLTLKDLKTLLESEPQYKVTVPGGRLKAPYLEQLQKAFPNQMNIKGEKLILEPPKTKTPSITSAFQSPKSSPN
mgnify:CR=1 FL=1